MVLRMEQINCFLKQDEQELILNKIDKAREGELLFECKTSDYWWEDIYDTLLHQNGTDYYLVVTNGHARWYKGALAK